MYIIANHYAKRQNHKCPVASARTRGRAAAATLPDPKLPRTTAPAIPAITGRHASTLAAQTLPEAVRAKAGADSRLRAARSSMKHRPATQQTGKSSESKGEPLSPGAQASRSARQPGLDSCGSPVPLAVAFWRECSSSALRRRSGGRRPPTELPRDLR